MADRTQILDLLHELIQTCKDGETGYAHAAGLVDDPKLKAYFSEESLERSRFVQDLKLHAKQLGEDPEQVISDLKGRVALQNGIANFSAISFSVPGATANMHGTYNLTDKRVNLSGKMKMQATVSQATHGVKSFFLKLLDPFFKKKKAGAEVPVTMKGSYGHTHFSAGLK